MAILQLHRITLKTSEADTGTKYYVLLNPNTYSGIETIVGIQKVTDADELNNPRYSVGELIGAGIVRRMLVSGKASGNKRRTFNILVAKDKMQSAIDGIKGKTINGVTVGAGRIKRTAVFY